MNRTSFLSWNLANGNSHIDFEDKAFLELIKASRAEALFFQEAFLTYKQIEYLTSKLAKYGYKYAKAIMLKNEKCANITYAKEDSFRETKIGIDYICHFKNKTFLIHNTHIPNNTYCFYKGLHDILESKSDIYLGDLNARLNINECKDEINRQVLRILLDLKDYCIKAPNDSTFVSKQSGCLTLDGAIIKDEIDKENELNIYIDVIRNLRLSDHCPIIMHIDDMIITEEDVNKANEQMQKLVNKVKDGI